MASKSLGTLTIDLIAKIGGFVSGMDKAERASEKWRKQVQEDTKEASKAIATMATATAAAATAVGVAGYQLLKSTSSQVAETDKWAKSLNMSTQELLAWQFAAEKAGLSGDNMADIFKDIGDKIGDAVLNKSGEAVDALDALGLSAEKLSKVTPDKQLLAIGDALSKVSTNAGKINILEGLGNDLSKMLPLFDNNNEKLKQFLQLAKDYGVAPDPDSIDDLVKVNDLFQDMEAQVKGLKIEIAAGLAKVDLSPLQSSLDDLQKVLTDPKVLQGIVSLVEEVASLAGWLVRTAAAAGTLAATATARHQGAFGTFSDDNVDAMQSRIKFLQFQANGAMASDADLAKINAEIDELQKKIADAQAENAPKINLPTGQATVGTGEYGLPQGGTNGKATPDAGAKKLESAYRAAEQSYLKQIELIDTTGKKTAVVTEQQKLAFDLATGKLTGLNDAQKKRLEQLATEVDRLNAVKKANEDNIKVAEFAATLRRQNENSRQEMDLDLFGMGMGSQSRERLKAIAEIKKKFTDQQLELNDQFNRDGNKDLYDKETQALRTALNDRLNAQQDYYEKSDEKKKDWSSGISEALVDFADQSSDYYQQAADAMTSVLGAATSSISDHLADVVNGTESAGEAIKGVFSDLGQAVIKALVDMAAQWLVYQGVQLLVGKSAQAAAIPAMIANAQATALQAQIAAYASTAAIPIIGPGLAPAAMAAAAAVTEPLVAAVSATSVAGMAHDGIDSVPETGTWLLQKGERITTAQTSAKLDATLERVNKDANPGGNAYNPTINIPINGNPSDATILLVRKAAAQGAQDGYNMAVNDVASKKGRLSMILRNGWGRGPRYE